MCRLTRQIITRHMIISDRAPPLEQGDSGKVLRIVELFAVWRVQAFAVCHYHTRHDRMQPWGLTPGL